MGSDRASAAAFTAASDSSLLVSFGGAISPEATADVVALATLLETQPQHGVLNIHPAYCSVLVVFDPLETSHEALQPQIERCIANARWGHSLEPRVVDIPVCYGGEYGPDLDALAELRGLHAADVIELHASAEYTASFIGFVPGFAYLSGLPEQIGAPRLTAPRQKVPPGSVGIAGSQTGVYPFATPGGWRLIARTPVKMFDPTAHPVSRIQLGDKVRFQPISAEEFERITERAH